MMYVGLILYFLFFFTPALAVTLLIGWLTRRLPHKIHTPLLILISCLLLTPTLGPATIAVVPVTFGWWFVPTLLTGTWSDLASWVMDYPRWHAFAFPATAFLSYLVIRKVHSSNSFKADGAAAA
jgi:hypothetical protein